MAQFCRRTFGWADGMVDWVPVTQIAGVTIADAAVPPAPPPPAIEQSTGSFFTEALGGLLTVIGAGAGVLALVGVGYFVVWPMLTADDANQDAGGLNDDGQAPSWQQPKPPPFVQLTLEEKQILGTYAWSGFLNGGPQLTVFLDNRTYERYTKDIGKSYFRKIGVFDYWAIVGNELVTGWPVDNIYEIRRNVATSRISRLVYVADVNDNGDRLERIGNNRFEMEKIK